MNEQENLGQKYACTPTHSEYPPQGGNKQPHPESALDQIRYVNVQAQYV